MSFGTRHALEVEGQLQVHLAGPKCQNRTPRKLESCAVPRRNAPTVTGLRIPILRVRSRGVDIAKLDIAKWCRKGPPFHMSKRQRFASLLHRTGLLRATLALRSSVSSPQLSVLTYHRFPDPDGDASFDDGVVDV